MSEFEAHWDKKNCTSCFLTWTFLDELRKNCKPPPAQATHLPALWASLWAWPRKKDIDENKDEDVKEEVVEAERDNVTGRNATSQKHEADLDRTRQI